MFNKRALLGCKIANIHAIRDIGLLMDLGKRIKNLRKDQGWTQLDLSKATSLSRGRIAQIETNPLAEVKGESLVSLAKAFGYSTEQLLSADELGLLAGMRLQPVTKKVPVISWASLESVMNGKFMLESNQWVGCPHDISDNSFVLEVENDLMTSSTGRSYPRGAYIFIDQDRLAKSGDRVIAIDRNTMESVFRELVIDGGIKYLKPLNTAYPVQQCSESTHIIGVIVGSYMAE